LERAILRRRAGFMRWWPKISSSAWKVTVVPRRFGVGPRERIGPLRQAAGEFLRVELAVPRDLDPHVVGERVDDRDADAVEAAGGLVGLARELAARVERAEDDLERGLAGELRVRVHRDAAAVVADGDGVVGVKLDLDAGGVARHRLVHRVVEDFGDEVVERAFVGAADVHAGALADRLEPLEHLDRGGVVGGIGPSGEEGNRPPCCSSSRTGRGCVRTRGRRAGWGRFVPVLARSGDAGSGFPVRSG
jgi:hypothetical protein